MICNWGTVRRIVELLQFLFRLASFNDPVTRTTMHVRTGVSAVERL